jgi:hypothetical protein
MNNTNSIISLLNPAYFWDINLSKLEEASASRLIIERVFSLGEINEMNQVITSFGSQKVVDVLTKLPYIDPKTLNFISKIFNKPLKTFRCYRLKQLRPQFWSS